MASFWATVTVSQLRSGCAHQLGDSERDMEGILELLCAVHLKGFAHGDARLENVISVATTLLWIDFLESPPGNDEGRRFAADVQLLGEEKRLDFTNFADRWPQDERYLVEVLQPQLGDMVHA
mmetsp:Transcript_45867/g.109215  ORF Transcript_45867/g.109215 Transcript_45867/m.109215 type:complete len:122 (-) Transcript_45867:99-464(-)